MLTCILVFFTGDGEFGNETSSSALPEAGKDHSPWTITAPCRLSNETPPQLQL